MSSKYKKSIGWALVLVLLGVITFVAGPNWLALLIPAAALVWYGASPALNGGRN
jgi:hypothetical protein